MIHRYGGGGPTTCYLVVDILIFHCSILESFYSISELKQLVVVWRMSENNNKSVKIIIKKC